MSAYPTQGQRPKSDPAVDYMGPEHGPFRCERCVHFRGPNRCELVAGAIAPRGCCNLFSDVPEGA